VICGCHGGQCTSELITGGVLLQGNNSLNIYSQSSGDKEGRLESSISQSEYKGNAGIGCSDGYKLSGSPDGMGTLVIHGGDISAKGSHHAAGIGGGNDRGIRPSGSVTIWAGKVTATGGERAAGIGGGNGAGRWIFNDSSFAQLLCS